MCTRYALLEPHLQALLKQLGLSDGPDFASRYNLAPGSLIPAVRAQPETTVREAVALRWGFVPHWAKEDVGFKMLNARAETIAGKPAFRDALRHRRCVIPASGYYEWQSAGRDKLPWLYRLRDAQPFWFAGLWETWSGPGGPPLSTCCIITTAPNELTRTVHDRMPAILDTAAAGAWLDPALREPAQIAAQLQVFPAQRMSARRVSRFVSNVRHEGPACFAPPGPAEADAGDAPQLSLGLE
jgi:putative SOS response-associated peptidase YedK